MNTEVLLERKGNGRSIILFVICMLVFIGAVITAHFVQRDYGRVTVSNVYYDNYNGKRMRAKLFRPLPASEKNPLPGVVFIHGYQNIRESGDAAGFCESSTLCQVALADFAAAGGEQIAKRGQMGQPFAGRDGG